MPPVASCNSTRASVAHIMLVICYTIPHPRKYPFGLNITLNVEALRGAHSQLHTYIAHNQTPSTNRPVLLRETTLKSINSYSRLFPAHPKYSASKTSTLTPRECKKSVRLYSHSINSRSHLFNNSYNKPQRRKLTLYVEMTT